MCQVKYIVIESDGRQLYNYWCNSMAARILKDFIILLNLSSLLSLCKIRGLHIIDSLAKLLNSLGEMNSMTN